MLSRREFLSIGAAGVAGAAVPFAAGAQTPKRGGTLTLRTWDPPHFDHILAHRVQDPHRASRFTHSRLLKHKAGPRRPPGTLPHRGRPRRVVEAAQRDDLRLQAPQGRALARQAARQRPRAHRRGRRVHLRALPHRQGQRQRAHARLGRPRSRRSTSTPCRFTLKEPFAWFLDMIANPMAVRHHRQGVRREVRRSQEAGGGDRHRPLDARQPTGPTSALTLVRNPHYFLPGLPYIDRVEMHGGRGQRLAHGRLPRRQVRPRLGVPGHDQPHRLGADQGHAEAAAPGPADAGVPVQRQ